MTQKFNVALCIQAPNYFFLNDIHICSFTLPIIFTYDPYKRSNNYRARLPLHFGLKLQAVH